MNKKILKTICFVAIISLLQAGIFAIKPAAAYFNDRETSPSVLYEAGSLEFSLNSAGDFSPAVTPSDSSSRTIQIQNIGSLGFKYLIGASNFSGDLCDTLQLIVSLNGGTSVYTGPLKDFSNYDAGTFTASSNWNFLIPAIPDNPDLQGKTCSFDFVFNGSQDNGFSGFSDTETISNIVKSGYWNAPVVLNEFLPHAGNYPEYVELYNKTDASINLANFYIQADKGIIPINSTTTAQYSGGSTIIAGKGWLVVTSGGDLMNDDSGTVTLYNPSGVEVDSHSYTPPDYNINNSPGGTNNLVGYWPFDGDLKDKSGNGNDGTSVGTTGFAGGIINQALDLNGSQGYIEIPDSSSLDITNQITLEAWVYPRAWDNQHENSILTKAADNDWGVWNIHYKTQSKGFRFELGGKGTVFETTPSTALNTWYHIVGVYDGIAMKLYVNGVLSNSQPMTGPIKTNNAPLRIGKQFWWGSNYSYWDGLIDELKIYNRALSADEVQEHYNDVSTPPGIVPPDKSIARIPDGSSTWYDPMPTPGAPNKLSEEEEIDLGLVTLPTTTIPEETTTTITTTIPEETTTTTTTTIPEETTTTTITTTTTEPSASSSADTTTTTTTTTVPPTTTTTIPEETTTTTTTTIPEETTITTIPEETTTTTTTTIPEETTTTTTTTIPEETTTTSTTTTTTEPPVSSTTTTTVPETTTTIPEETTTTTTTTTTVPPSTTTTTTTTEPTTTQINIYLA